MTRINLRQGRDFANAIGQLATTDRLDARVLKHMAQPLSQAPCQPHCAAHRHLAERVQQRS